MPILILMFITKCVGQTTDHHTDMEILHVTSTNHQLKGVVRRKQRWVKSGSNRQLLLYCLDADISSIHLKGHHSLKSITPVSVFNDHKN